MTPRHTTRPVSGTAFHVLLALSDRDRYGLGIAEEVHRRTEGTVRLGPGTLYNTVRALLRDDLIAELDPSEVPEADADPRRRYYRITPRGRRTLREEAERLQRVLDVARDKDVLPADGPP